MRIDYIKQTNKQTNKTSKQTTELTISIVDMSPEYESFGNKWSDHYIARVWVMCSISMISQIAYIKV